VNIYKANVQSLLKNKVGTAARQPLSDQYLFKTLKQGMDKLTIKRKINIYFCVCIFLTGAIFGLEEMFLSG